MAPPGSADPFSGTLAPGAHPALLVVDMVMAYLDPASSLFLDGEAAVAATARLAAAARAAAAPVIFTRVVYAPGGVDGGLFYRKVPALAQFQAGSPLGAFPPALTPAAGDIVVTKQYASAFFGTALTPMLTTLGIDTLLITGFSTSGCVRASALDALQNGFAPFVVRDGCADRGAAQHDANLFDLQAKYAEVVDEDQARRILARG